MKRHKKNSPGASADEAGRKASNPLGARQTIAEQQENPDFQRNHKRLRAERLAREAKENE